MRMWMVEPKVMCNKHLLGEHVEIHMFIGTINKKKKLNGYVKNNLLEFDSLQDRHFQLSKEMLKRGFKHVSSLPSITNKNYDSYILQSKVIKEESQKELINRCPDCKYMIEKGVTCI